MSRTALRHAKVAVALLALACAGLGCDRANRPDGDQLRGSSTDAPVALATAPSTPSIYPIHVALRDQDGLAIDLDVHRGHPVIVSMFYGSCPTACPLLVSNIKELEASLPPEVRAETRVLLVSFDREHDTPQALSVLAAKHHVATDRWRLATGADEDVRQIASALDVSYRKQPDGSFVHDSVIAVLDAEGRITARTAETLPDLAPLVAALKRDAAHGAH